MPLVVIVQVLLSLLVSSLDLDAGSGLCLLGWMTILYKVVNLMNFWFYISLNRLTTLFFSIRVDILAAFAKATQYANKWSKAWHKWALFNTAVMSHYTLRGYPASQFVVAAVTGYFHSIACAANSKGVDDSLQVNHTPLCKKFMYHKKHLRLHQTSVCKIYCFYLYLPSFCFSIVTPLVSVKNNWLRRLAIWGSYTLLKILY